MTTRPIKNEADNFYAVPGFEGLYEISVSGQVRSLPRVVKSRGGTRTIPERDTSVRIRNGYPSFHARTGKGSGHHVSVHRCLAILFVPNPDNKPHVNHIDGNKANFDLGNLEWCTHLENMRHAFRTGLAPLPVSGPGDKSPAAKLDWDDVRNIRRLAETGMRRDAIADQYGCCKSNINQIVRGETWREGAQ